MTIHFRNVVSAVRSLHDGIDYLLNGVLHVPGNVYKMIEVLVPERSELIAKGKVSATSVLVAGVVVLGPEVTFVAIHELLRYAGEMLEPVVDVLLAVELRGTLELHLESTPFPGLYLSCGEVMEGDKNSFNVEAEDATSVPVADGLGCSIHALDLGCDVLRSSFVLHEPVDTVEFNLKVELAVEDEFREFNAEGFFDVDNFHHGTVARIVVIVFEESLGAVLKGTIVVFVKVLL
jgi:hypothetical protein